MDSAGVVRGGRSHDLRCRRRRSPGIAMSKLFPIIDGHNDVLSRLLEAERARERSAMATGQDTAARGFFDRGEQGHIDLPRAREGGFAGGLFSIYVSADPQA